MNITLPEIGLVVFIGASGSGKSTFARRHFKATEVISSDFCRGLVADDENDQSATPDAFAILHFIAARRLAAGRLTVIDATSVQPEARKSLLKLAREYHVQTTAIVFNIPEKLCHERNQQRSDRHFGHHVIRQQVQQLRRSLRGLKDEGFSSVHIFDTPAEIDALTITRVPLWNNKKGEHGPFDIIGDIHGCFNEISTLLQKLGYSLSEKDGGYQVNHPQGRKVIFLGDLVDRGPAVPEVLKLVMSMVDSGSAYCVAGNHDVKLLRKLRGKNVNLTHGIVETLTQLEQAELKNPALRQQIMAFLDRLVSHYVLDDGKLVVAHAGLKEDLQGRASGAVREFALYGETTGETDEFGLPIRYNWAAEYRGKAMVVYGHTPVLEPEWLNHTINIDTGCVFGGKLTALRYPERELVAVPAEQVYCATSKPFQLSAQTPSLSAQQQHDDLLDISDVQGKRIISTRLNRSITIREENAIAALEVMSRFAANPKWLIYLPPTMSPCATSLTTTLLEHPVEAFDYYRKEGIQQVVCEEKHMGSRAIVILCRNEDIARTRFGVVGEGNGICYTRTGRHFFDDKELENALLKRLQTALDTSNFWEELETDWVCLDCELMPWSMKAQTLLLQQYAAVGSAAQISLQAAVNSLKQAQEHGVDTDELLNNYQQRQDLAQRYREAYRRYCWPVNSVDDLRLAPFHILATQGKVHSDKSHIWHMTTLTRICAVDPTLLLATPYQVIELNNEESVQHGIDWWTDLTHRGGEGMVIKPLQFLASGQRGIVQPAIKCRGPEYLRIIYGPEYSLPENRERLQARALGPKRSLALREFALGLEALERFVEQEPLRRVHECVFGVLALESEPVDPRL